MFILRNRSWLYRRRLVKNIGNGLGTSMIKELSQEAESLWIWSNFYVDKWQEQS